jgi:hypothetical protein
LIKCPICNNKVPYLRRHTWLIHGIPYGLNKNTNPDLKDVIEALEAEHKERVRK